MARVQTGPLVSDATGRASGLIFRRTRFGLVVQGAPKTVIHTTAAAQIRKMYFRIAMSAWRSLPKAYYNTFLQALKDDNKGIPGPWITQWLAYAGGGALVWPYVNEPNTYLGTFSGSAIGPTTFTVTFASKPASCNDAHVFLFNDSGPWEWLWTYSYSGGTSKTWTVYRKPLAGSYKGVIIPSQQPPYTKIIRPATFSITFP